MTNLSTSSAKRPSAVNMRYPHQTYILDDGNRPEVKELAEELDCNYISRTDRSNVKASI